MREATSPPHGGEPAATRIGRQRYTRSTRWGVKLGPSLGTRLCSAFPARCGFPECVDVGPSAGHMLPFSGVEHKLDYPCRKETEELCLPSRRIAHINRAGSFERKRATCTPWGDRPPRATQKNAFAGRRNPDYQTGRPGVKLMVLRCHLYVEKDSCTNTDTNHSSPQALSNGYSWVG